MCVFFLMEDSKAEAYELYVACKNKRRIKDDVRVLAQERGRMEIPLTS